MEPEQRRGAAASEFALVLPFLMLLFLMSIDFARAFYFSLITADCARNGAVYATDPLRASESPYQNVNQAALAGVSSWNPAPTVTPQSGVDDNGNATVAVTVSYPFQTIMSYPGMPGSLNASTTVTMQMRPTIPN